MNLMERLSLDEERVKWKFLQKGTELRTMLQSLLQVIVRKSDWMKFGEYYS